jgi:hypothetical protein
MAKAPKNIATPSSIPDAPAPAEDTVKSLTFGGFEFKMEIGVGLDPADLKPKARGANPLPFRSWFDTMPDKAAIFLPLAFWEARRSPEDAQKPITGTFVRNKVRGQFNAWVEMDEANRDNRNLIILDRPKGHNGDPRPGHLVYMQFLEGDALVAHRANRARAKVLASEKKQKTDTE